MSELVDRPVPTALARAYAMQALVVEIRHIE